MDLTYAQTHTHTIYIPSMHAQIYIVYAKVPPPQTHTGTPKPPVTLGIFLLSFTPRCLEGALGPVS